MAAKQLSFHARFNQISLGAQDLRCRFNLLWQGVIDAVKKADVTFGSDDALVLDRIYHEVSKALLAGDGFVRVRMGEVFVLTVDPAEGKKELEGKIAAIQKIKKVLTSRRFGFRVEFTPTAAKLGNIGILSFLISWAKPEKKP